MQKSLILILLGLFVSITYARRCFESCNECPQGSHCEKNVVYCKGMGYDSESFICVRDQLSRIRSISMTHGRPERCVQFCGECSPGTLCKRDNIACMGKGSPFSYSNLCASVPDPETPDVELDDPICVQSCEQCPRRTERCVHDPSYCSYLGHSHGESIFCEIYPPASSGQSVFKKGYTAGSRAQHLTA